MRIAIFSDNFYPELSGISDSLIMTGRELGKRGYQIRFYAPSYSRKNYEKLGLSYEEPDLGPNISIERFFALPFPTGTGQGRLVIPGFHTLSIKKFQPDIIHSNHIFGVGLEALIASRLLKKPFVATKHTPITEFLHYSPIRADWVENLALRYEVWYHNKAQFVTSPSQAIFDEMADFEFRPPHRVLPNPLNLDVFKPLGEKKKLKEKFGFPGFVILYAGRLAPEKRIDLIIDSLPDLRKKIPDVNFVIVGKGSDEERLKKIVSSLGLKNSVRFLGFIKDPSDLARVYNASDIFVIMSTAETQCISAMQAMACKIPVIAAKAWGLKEYITDGKNGLLVKPGDAAALKNNILELFNNLKLSGKIGEEGYKSVKKFSIPKIADEWEKIYGVFANNANKV